MKIKKEVQETLHKLIETGFYNYYDITINDIDFYNVDIVKLKEKTIYGYAEGGHVITFAVKIDNIKNIKNIKISNEREYPI